MYDYGQHDLFSCGGDADFGWGFSFKSLIPGPIKWLANAAVTAGRGIASATHTVAQGISSAAELVGKVPIIGGALHAALSIADGPFQLVASVCSGERVDKAALNFAKTNISAVREVAPYAEMVITSIPGVGSVAAAGLAMGAALASGRPIDEAIMSGVKNAVPGGALGKAVFDVTSAAVQGDNILSAASKSALNQLPPTARAALNVVQKAAKGDNIAKAALDEARSALPPQAQVAFNAAVAVATGKNLQGAINKGLQQLTSSQLTAMANSGIEIANKNPMFKATRELLDTNAKPGFDVGVAMMSKTGVNEKTIGLIRTKLRPAQRGGFDMAVSSHIGQVTAPLAANNMSVKAKAAFYATHGMRGASKAMRKNMLTPIKRDSEARKGALWAIKQISKKETGLWQSIKQFLGVA